MKFVLAASLLFVSHSVCARQLVTERFIPGDFSAFKPLFDDADGDSIDDLVFAMPTGIVVVSGADGSSIGSIANGGTPWQHLQLEVLPGDPDSLPDLLFVGPGVEFDDDARGVVYRFATPIGDLALESEGVVKWELRGDSECGGFESPVTIDGRVLLVCSGRVLVINLDTETVQARLHEAGYSLRAVGDLDRDGVGEFVATHTSTDVFSASIETDDWTLARSPGAPSLLTLEHDAARTPRACVNLGDPTPDDGVDDHILMCQISGGVAVQRVEFAPERGLEATSLGAFNSPERGFAERIRIAGDVNRDGVLDCVLGQTSFVDPDRDRVVGRLLVVDGRGLLDGYDENDIIQEIVGTPAMPLNGDVQYFGDSDGDGAEEIVIRVQGPNSSGLQVFEVSETAVVIDCNLNNVDDRDEIAAGVEDCNDNGIPDECDVSNYDIRFAEAQSLQLEVEPWRMRWIHFDRDAHLDLVTVDQGGGTVSVVRGGESSTFEIADTFATGTHAGNVETADFDGDGRLDVVVTPSEGGPDDPVAVLLQTGDGLSEPILTPIGERLRGGVAAGDLDLDGNTDVVVCDSTPRFHLLFGLGDGEFGRRRFVAGGAEEIVIADINRDRIPDLCIAGGRFGFQVRLGVGGGNFAAAVEIPVEDRIDTLRVCDLNRDDRLDFVGIDGATNEVVYSLGDGNGRFERVVRLAVGLSPRSVEVADVNGDGRVDLLVANEFSRDVTAWFGGADQLFLRRSEIAGVGASSIWAVVDTDDDGAYEIVNSVPNSKRIDIYAGSLEPALDVDCDANGVPDSCSLAIAAYDTDANGVLDVCEPGGESVPGDCNADGSFNISDPLCVLGFLFFGEPAQLPCGDGPDAIGNRYLVAGVPTDPVNISHAVSALLFLFGGGVRHPLLPVGVSANTCVPIFGCRAQCEG